MRRSFRARSSPNWGTWGRGPRSRPAPLCSLNAGNDVTRTAMGPIEIDEAFLPLGVAYVSHNSWTAQSLCQQLSSGLAIPAAVDRFAVHVGKLQTSEKARKNSQRHLPVDNTSLPTRLRRSLRCNKSVKMSWFGAAPIKKFPTPVCTSSRANGYCKGRILLRPGSSNR